MLGRIAQYHLLICSAGAFVAMAPAPALAQAQSFAFHIQAQPLDGALRAFARATHQQVLFDRDLVRGKQSGGLSGTHTAEEGITLLLAGSGLQASRTSGGAYVIRAGRSALNAPLPAQAATPMTAAGGTDIIVTGTRIRGAPIASPVISLEQEDFRNAGRSNLGDVVRNLPQSFGGGQNSGVGTNVPAANGVDVGGGASINLRGMGSAATLTLLDGHRLSYSSSRQSVDVSAIPLEAVDRIEIVPDGASALYGSDAVAGVANIILRHDFRGLETNVALGSSTDGGNFEQQYGAIGGAGWASGSLVAAYEYGSNSEIDSKDRSYAEHRSPGLTLFPALRHNSLILTGRQALTGSISFDVDALYNKRSTSSYFPLNFAGDLDISGGHLFGTAESYDVIPSLRIDLGPRWRLRLTGGYGRDRVDYAVDVFFSGVSSHAGAGYYLNRSKSLELDGDGALFRLPGGLAKIAFGGGYRTIDFASFKGATSFENLTRSQDNYFGYGEISLPVISPDQRIAFARRLNFSAALRYEDYPGIGDVVTPKLGAIFEPSPDLALKASFGNSFRAPTLLEHYQNASVTLATASSLGGAGFPPNATALIVQGGNPDLKPERARSWSATMDLHPRTVPGAKLEISYFSTRYRDRIVTPIGVRGVALSNPIYRNFVNFTPTDAQKAAVLASPGTFINAAGAPYDPANVVAIIDNDNINAGFQKFRGVDLLLSYRSASSDGGGSFEASVDGAYLESGQQLSSDQPIVPLAGTIFNPPHFRGRGSATWVRGLFSITGAVNYFGPVRDTRFSPNVHIAGMTTADFTLGLSTGAAAGVIGNLDLRLSVLNAFNAKPAPIATAIFTDTPYDSTNYSPVGRFIRFGITKKW